MEKLYDKNGNLRGFIKSEKEPDSPGPYIPKCFICNENAFNKYKEKNICNDHEKLSDERKLEYITLKKNRNIFMITYSILYLLIVNNISDNFSELIGTIWVIGLAISQIRYYFIKVYMLENDNKEIKKNGFKSTN